MRCEENYHYLEDCVTDTTELLEKEDLEQRKLWLNFDIEQPDTEKIIKQIIRYNKYDIDKPVKERLPIMLYITSNGGDITAGFQLIDVIQNSKTPVYTINLGYQYSTGFLVGLAGKKRYATSNSTFLVHDGISQLSCSSSKIYDQIDFCKKIDERIKSYILKNSRLSEEEYENKRRVEWYFFADEAKEKGFIDYIVGEDCDIDAIL